MKEIIIWIIVSGLLFAAFIVVIVLSVLRENKKLAIASVFIFLACLITAACGTFRVVTHAYDKAVELYKKETEI